MDHREAGTPRIVFSIGDVNGIGPEVLARALSHPAVTVRCTPVIAGNRRLVHEHLARISDLAPDALDAHAWIEIESDATLRPGTVDAGAGRLAGQSIERAADAVRTGLADALVTMPISKAGLHAGGFHFPGHTEMLGAFTDGDPLMILLTDALRVALVTVHVPIAAVNTLLSAELIVHRLRQFHRSLRRDFAVERPTIAVLGLNPHAGESGEIGREEVEVVAPALQTARREGMDVSGPHAADGFFSRFDPAAQDGVLAMYHDQGLIPLKLLARGSGVNFTAGLSIVRTSPDHGTAYELAGRGRAEERSTIEAIDLAMAIVRHRLTAEAALQ